MRIVYFVFFFFSKANGNTVSSDSDTVRQRKGKKQQQQKNKKDKVEKSKDASPVKVAGILNLLADIMHNFTGAAFIFLPKIIPHNFNAPRHKKLDS